MLVLQVAGGILLAVAVLVLLAILLTQDEFARDGAFMLLALIAVVGVILMLVM